jgi:hypothetical protein
MITNSKINNSNVGRDKSIRIMNNVSKIKIVDCN